MNEIKNYNLPEHINTLHEVEALSSMELAREIADKINELVRAYNSLRSGDLRWKQAQEGIIRKGVIYMKDNLINSLADLLSIYDKELVGNLVIQKFDNLFVTPQKFGAVGNGVKNDIEAIEKAIASLDEGGVLYFPPGTYLMEGRPVSITRKNVTFIGGGLILCDYGFRPLASGFTAQGMRMEALGYSQENRAFMIDNSKTNGDRSKYVENFTFKDCSFKNFFYSVYASGGSYSYDGTEALAGFPVRDIVIENCHSVTYTNQNAGHFQCIQVENISYINNRTFGGQNASSYNAIKGNGQIRVIGNYDMNNSYASCEIENGSGKAVIANNTFGRKIWIDDSHDVVVTGNYVGDNINVTVGSDNGDAINIIISNNRCSAIRCEQFGEYLGGIIRNVNIIGNIVRGSGTHQIWVHGNAVEKVNICNNFMTGTATNAISVQRNEQLTCYIQGNFGNGKTLLIAGSGGKVFALDNYDINVSGIRDSLPVSHYEREFNGVKITDEDGISWRLGVSTSGTVGAIKY